MTKQEQINSLYNQITIANLKEKTIMAISDKTGRAYNSINVNWIGRQKIPEKYLDIVLETVNNAIKIQDEHINNLDVNL